MYISDNYDLFRRHEIELEEQEEERKAYEAEIEALEHRIYTAQSDLDDAMDLCRDYDIENNSDLADRLEKIDKLLCEIYDKLEGK